MIPTTTAVWGWELHPIMDAAGTDLKAQHVLPVHDLIVHSLSPECACDPDEDLDTPDMWFHHAADGREEFERGHRKPS